MSQDDYDNDFDFDTDMGGRTKKAKAKPKSRRRATSTKRAPSRWIAYVKRVQANKGCSYKKALILASKTWKS